MQTGILWRPFAAHRPATPGKVLGELPGTPAPCLLQTRWCCQQGLVEVFGPRVAAALVDMNQKFVKQAGNEEINEAMNQTGNGSMNEINHITQINAVNQSTNRAIIQSLTDINDIKLTQSGKRTSRKTNLTLAVFLKQLLFCRSIQTSCRVPRAPRCTTM